MRPHLHQTAEKLNEGLPFLRQKRRQEFVVGPDRGGHAPFDEIGAGGCQTHDGTPSIGRVRVALDEFAVHQPHDYALSRRRVHVAAASQKILRGWSGFIEDNENRPLRRRQLRIAKKFGEEAFEVVIGAKNHDKEEVANETADLLYHLGVLLYDQGVDVADVTKVLIERHQKKNNFKGERKDVDNY